MDKYLTILILLVSSYLIPPSLQSNQSKVLAAEIEPNEVINVTQPLKTLSRFEEKLQTKIVPLKRAELIKNDPEMELGEEKVLEEGSDGKKTLTYKVSFYEGQEYSHELIKTELENPKDRVTLKGTKIVWRTLNTTDGEIKYWRKMRVYATHYDSHCPGCNDTTAIGLKAGKGVIAVDPSVIKLRSKVYIPGYGKAIAGDTGGAIKGNIIDLGFDDARTAGWSAHYIDIYLL